MYKKIKDKLKYVYVDVLYSGHTSRTPQEAHDHFTVNAAGCLAALTVLYLVTLHGSEGHESFTFLELSAAAALMFNLLVLRASGDLRLARFVIALSLFALMVGHVYTGGYHETGIYWLYIYPLGIVFIYGKRLAGYAWLLALFAVLILAAILVRYDIIYLSFSAIELIEALQALVLVSVGVIVYQMSLLTLEDKVRIGREKLRIEKAQSEAIIAQVKDVIVVTDAEGVVRATNDSAETVFGYSKEELIGQSWVETMRAVDDRGNVIDEASRPEQIVMKERQSVEHLRVNYLRKDNSVVTVDVVANVFRQDGKIVGFLASMRDVTEIDKADRAKNDFVNLASHQLRTPIASIRWHAELLLGTDSTKLKKDEVDSMKAIANSAKEMSMFVNDLLKMTRIESNDMLSANSDVNMSEVIDRVVADYDKQLGERGITISIEVAKNIPTISINESALIQCISSLIDNAISYSPDKSIINIIVHKYHGHIIIKIKDTGIGIPEHQKAMLFHKFFRADNAKRIRPGGTGLGLYFVRTILTLMQGTIRFESKIGEGTTFIIHLPLYSKNDN